MILRAGFCILALISMTAAARAEMTLTSTDISEGATLGNAQVFDGFGCTGDDLSPQLSWQGAPDGTQSFAVMVYDPDAPTGSGWWHWTAFNIPASVQDLPTGASSGASALPPGTVQGRTDFGMAAFGGACPPEGATPHRYIFTVYALPMAEIPLDETASGALVGFYVLNNALASASLTALYGR